MILLTEVRRQAQVVGDTITLEAINNLTYTGPLPELRPDGAYLSIYDNLRIIKLAGMKYRGDLSNYVGDFRGILKPEPNNEYDKSAIMVKCEDGKLLGYIPEHHTDLVRWLVGVEQPIGGEPTLFEPYQISGHIIKKTDSDSESEKYDGWIYITKHQPEDTPNV